MSTGPWEVVIMRFNPGLSLLFLLLLPVAAAAEPDPNRLFNEALELAKKGATMDAVSIWLDVLQRVESRYRPSVHKALGMGYGKLGHAPEASYHLSRFLDTRMKAESTNVRERLSTIEDKLAGDHRRVTVACEPRGSVVYLDGEGKGVAYPCPLTWWFPLSKLQVRVEQVGYLPAVVELEVGEGGHQQLVTAVLRPTEKPEKMGAARIGEVAGRIRRAAMNGHLTLLRKLVR